MLSVSKRKEMFNILGFEYSKGGIRAFQRRYMARKKDVDGIYGPDTENTLLTVYNTSIYTKNFSPEEFRCGCGGRYCCGYPNYMKPEELKLIQAIRSHWGRPVTITCGLRCKPYNNSLRGSVKNSKHLSGKALDFYQVGVTDTLANRKASLKWIKKQANFSYGYGNGINSTGYRVSAPYMGNALHVDVK